MKIRLLTLLCSMLFTLIASAQASGGMIRRIKTLPKTEQKKITKKRANQNGRSDIDPDRHERFEAQKVNASDKRMVSELFATYFKALALGDEALLATTLAPVLTSFLHKEQATKSDVVKYMKRIHEPDIQQIMFELCNDWKIEKQPAEDNMFSYTVYFSVDQRIERSDESKKRFYTYKVMAKLTTDCKICELNMKMIVQ